MTIKHDPRAEGNPSPDLDASRGPTTPASTRKIKIPPDLAALEVRRIWETISARLPALSVPELYARAFDIGEEDPAQSVALKLADELVVLSAALTAESPLAGAVVERVLFRAVRIAELAAELHRRQRVALLAALAEQEGAAP